MWDWTSAAARAQRGVRRPQRRRTSATARARRCTSCRRRAAAWACERASGPFPFPDGSLEVVGRGILRDIFACARVREYAAAEYRRPRPPYWTHEDAGLGALVHRETSLRRLPLTHVALRRWEHNRFWVNWADLSTLVDGNVLWVHYTRDAERAEYVADAYMARRSLTPDGLSCGGCFEEWGGTAPHNGTTCCTKPTTRPRVPAPRRGCAPRPPPPVASAMRAPRCSSL